MKKWLAPLIWAISPLLFLASVIGLLAVINWDYEAKLFTPDKFYVAPDNLHAYMGHILLGLAIALALFAGGVLFLVRFYCGSSEMRWFFIPLTIVTIFLIMPSLFIVVMAPAAITMQEQLRQGAH